MVKIAHIDANFNILLPKDEIFFCEMLACPFIYCVRSTPALVNKSDIKRGLGSYFNVKWELSSYNGCFQK